MCALFLPFAGNPWLRIGEPNLAAVIGLAGKELGKTFLLRFANAAISLHVKKFRHVDPRIALQLMTSELSDRVRWTAPSRN